MIEWSTYLCESPIQCRHPYRRVDNMTFLADCMLGKLARWLRILDYDTVYDNFAEDDDLLANAETESRILLTRDGPLADRAGDIDGVRCVFIEEGRLADQIAQLVTDVDLDLSRETFRRCLECNVPIASVRLEDVATSVPAYVKATQTEFFRCPDCERVYWSGTHTERMTERLTEIRAAVERRQQGTARA